MEITNKGKVISVTEAVIEVEFMTDPRPRLRDVLVLEKDPTIKMQVMKSSDNTRFYCIGLSKVRSVKRGDIVCDTGESLKIPVGAGILGRVMNVFGEPKDGLGEIKYDKLNPVFNESPSYADTVADLKFLETGIKIVDLYAPLVQGGKVGLFGGSGVGKTMLLTEILHNIINKDVASENVPEKVTSCSTN